MAEREANPVPADRGSSLRAAQSRAFLVGIGLCLVLSLGFAARALPRSENSTPTCAQERINPNEAPMASLMRLPQIGRSRARAIVAYREAVGTPPGQASAFQTADDLEQIKGIGPAIVEDVRPWLQFAALPRDGNEP